MENFDQIFTLLANEGISLNTDILETGLINILVLLAILIYTGRDFLGSLLEERRTTIIKGVQDAEDRLNESQKRLIEAQKQLNQVQLIISEIKSETKVVKSDILTREFSQANDLIVKQFSSASSVIQDREQLIIYYILRQVLQLTLFQAFRLFLLSVKDQHKKCLNDSIHLFVSPGGKV
jgi:F-type H+-transporting ATPase subunit b